MWRKILIIFCLVMFYSTIPFQIIEVSASSEVSTNEVTTTEVQSQDNSTEGFSLIEKSTEILKSNSTYVSTAITILFALYVFIFKKEIPSLFKTVAPFGLLVLLLLIRLCLYTKNPHLYVSLFVIVIYIIVFIVSAHFFETNNITSHEQLSTATKQEKNVSNLIQRLIKNSHPSIKCIQIYTVKENKTDISTEYNINFLSGSVKQGVNVNSLFSSTINLENEHLEDIKAIQEFYTKLTTDAANSENQQNVILLLIKSKIEQYKNELNSIKSTDEINEKDCYVARLLLIYLSIYNLITEHDTFIGLHRDSLGLKDDNIEARLFTYERTGILSSVLFDKMPYVFSYRRGQKKNGRFYYTFSCGKSKKYITIITLSNKSAKPYIDHGMDNSLNSIKRQIITALEKNESKEEI